MEKKAKTSSQLTAIVGKIVSSLEPLNEEDRSRVLRSSLAIIGANAGGTRESEPGVEPDRPGGKGSLNGMSAKATHWMKQNNLTPEQIETVFEMSDGDATLIAASLPGKGTKQQAQNAYVLKGLEKLFGSGEPVFEDKAARTACQNYGCYDHTNHTRYVNDAKNILVGSEEKGWRLTAPGLTHGAALVRELTGSAK